nr:hypothetical protein [Tanacetum cinerariifolium]
MPKLEDITYSDDKEDVDAEADFTNLETNIIVGPILTTRVHKDYLMSQINGDLSSATLTRKEPKRVHQALKDPSWIEAMKEELLQFKMQKENKFNVAGSGPIWLFDIDTLTKSMNYQPVTAGNQSNPSAGVQELFDAEKAGEENVQRYVLFPLWSSSTRNPQNT